MAATPKHCITIDRTAAGWDVENMIVGERSSITQVHHLDAADISGVVDTVRLALCAAETKRAAVEVQQRGGHSER